MEDIKIYEVRQISFKNLYKRTIEFFPTPAEAFCCIKNKEAHFVAQAPENATDYKFVVVEWVIPASEVIPNGR